MKKVINLSGGKDSTAMLLLMLEHKEPFDEIIFCDTTVEFPEMYEHLDLVERKTGVKITRLKPDKPYFYYLAQHKRTSPRATLIRQQLEGYGWPNPRARWCTAFFKRDAAERYLKAKYGAEPVCHCIGIATDEAERVDEKAQAAGLMDYPLIRYGYTEADALARCKAEGYTWGGLYDQKRRVSCWCCPLQGLSDLFVLYRTHPELWAQLLEWDKHCYNSFRNDYKLPTLNIVFKQIAARGIDDLTKK